MYAKIKKHIITGIIISVTIYLLISLFLDYTSVINSFRHFNFYLLPAVIILVLLNYFTRFLKWHYYLYRIKCKVNFGYSFLVFMSGLIMSVTPGKAGELIKSFMLKKDLEYPIRKTAPIIFAERYTDMLSLIFLALISGLVLGEDILLIVGIGLVFLIIVALMLNKNFTELLIKLFSRIDFFKKHSEKLSDSLENSSVLLSLKPMSLMTFLGVFTWFFECLALSLVVGNFNPDYSPIQSTFSYSLATILGSVSFLPGGLGVTDGSLAFLLSGNSLSTTDAVAATFIFRLFTLWFAVLLGILFLTFYKKKHGSLKEYI